jgi:SHOCT-like protein
MISHEKKYKFDVKENLSVNLQSENMGVKIIGWSEPKAELEIKIESIASSENDLDFDQIVHAELDEEGNSLEIELSDPEDITNYKSKVRLYIPHVSSIKAELENAGLLVENLQGDQEAETENGSIHFDHVNGSLKLTTENGAIKLHNCNGDVELESENGAIKMNSCEGNIKAQTENGVLKSTKGKGTLEFESENGMARVTGAAYSKAFITSENGGIFYEFDVIEAGQFNFQNQNGKLQLGIPDELPYKITASNQLGRFHIGLEGNYDQSSSDEGKTIEMIKGSGNVKIDLKNEHGSINLMKPGTRSQSIKVDFSSVSKILDKAMEHLPKEVDQKKIREKMEKAKVKLQNIKIPDIKLPDMEKINLKVEKALDDVGRELKDLKVEFSIDDIKEKAEEKISDIMGNVKDKFGADELKQEEKSRVDERSRMKILELLQDGKITADEAERLIQAMEGRNG